MHQDNGFDGELTLTSGSTALSSIRSTRLTPSHAGPVYTTISPALYLPGIADAPVPESEAEMVLALWTTRDERWLSRENAWGACRQGKECHLEGMDLLSLDEIVAPEVVPVRRVD